MRAPVSTRYQPRPALTGRSTLSARPALPAAAATGPDSPFAAEADQGAGSAAFAYDDPFGSDDPFGPDAAHGQDAPFGSASRLSLDASFGQPATADRAIPSFGSHSPFEPEVTLGAAAPGQHQASRDMPPAPVAGTPPWEPAPQPTTALPWAAIPMPTADQTPGGNFSARTRQEPPQSLWSDADSTGPAMAKSVFEPDLPEPGEPQADQHPTSALPSGWDDLPHAGAEYSQRQDSNGHPIYLWNPNSPTENFPAVPSGPGTRLTPDSRSAGWHSGDEND
jgi:hypothetical protein